MLNISFTPGGKKVSLVDNESFTNHGDFRIELGSFLNKVSKTSFKGSTGGHLFATDYLDIGAALVPANQLQQVVDQHPVIKSVLSSIQLEELSNRIDSVSAHSRVRVTTSQLQQIANMLGMVC